MGPLLIPAVGTAGVTLITGGELSLPVGTPGAILGEVGSLLSSVVGTAGGSLDVAGMLLVVGTAAATLDGVWVWL